MTIISIEETELIRKGRWGKKRILHLQCDFCQVEYERGFTQCCVDKKFHFCSKVCSGKAKKGNGVLALQTRKTNLEKFGTEHVFQSNHFKEKAKQTWIQTLGVDNPLKYEEIHGMGLKAAASKESREKAILTFKEHFGDTNPLQRNLQNTYSVQNSSQINEVLEKRKETYKQRYGVENPSQSDEIKEKKKQTCRKNHGVDWPTQNSDVLSKINRKRRFSYVLCHWKTQEELICVGSYEKAFIEWCNANQIDFDWQIAHKMPDGRVYIIDAYIKSGEFANTWVEIKGYMTERSRQKWEWFHANHPNDSQLWNRQNLKKMRLIK